MADVLSLQDAEIKLQLDLNRVSAGLRWEVAGILDDMRKELGGILATQEDRLTDYGKTRINRLIKQADEAIDRGYEDASEAAAKGTADIGSVVAKNTAKALQNIVGAAIDVGLPTVGYLEELAGDSIIQGATQKDWWKRQTDFARWRFKTTLQQGLVQGETNQQLLKRVLQSGEMEVTKREAAALIHTSVQTVANNARMETYRKNSEIVPRVRWFATLDSHICVRCVAMSGKVWETKTKKPTGHSTRFQNPPIHFNDRCLLIGDVATFRELGFDIDEPATGQRASSDGPVDADMTFDGYLRRMGPFYQEQVLGKGRADLWRSGKITLDQLIDGKGRELTVKQLKELYT